MRKLFAIALFILLGALIGHAQTALPAATVHSASVPWTLPSNCVSTQTCQFQVYKLQGTCPGTLSGSAGWTLVTTTAAQTTNYVDNNLPGSTQYSYDVEAIQTGTPANTSGPSNCQTITTPFSPLPPVVGTLTVN